MAILQPQIGITTILFDVGGVIITWLDAEAAADRHEELAQRLGYPNSSALFSRLYAGPEWQATRIGEKTAAQMMHEILAPHGLTTQDEQEQFLAELFEFEGVDPELIGLIESLAGRYQLGILSNAADTLEERLEQLGVARYFDPIVNSYRIGAAKPDERSYKITLEQLDVPAEQVYFIDDREWNIKAAEAMGIHGHLFTGVTTLKADLEQLAII